MKHFPQWPQRQKVVATTVFEISQAFCRIKITKSAELDGLFATEVNHYFSTSGYSMTSWGPELFWPLFLSLKSPYEITRDHTDEQPQT